MISPFSNAEEKAKEYSLNDAELIFAKKSNTETWELIQKRNLTNEENAHMLSAAYASKYHWEKIGQAVHKQRANWLLYRVYSKLKNGTMALAYAKQCLNLTKQNEKEMADFDKAYAYEAMSRSYAIIGDVVEAGKYHEMAKKLGEQIAKEEDRKLFLQDLSEGEWGVFRPNKSHNN